ncbi:MAG: glycosyltransferase [Caldilineaceae bacterium]|nr:glycosyltransferase [Caldilineaceae bacterium]
MNILFTYTGFLPADAWGGPVKIIYQNALELKRRGHHVHIATSNLLSKHQRLHKGNVSGEVNGLDVDYLQLYNIPKWPGTLGPTRLGPLARQRLKQLIVQADVIHVNAVRNALTLEGVHLAYAEGKPILLQPHGTLPHIVSSIRLKQMFDSVFLGSLLSKIDAFLALQQAELQQIVAAGGDPELVHIVPNGLATQSTLKPEVIIDFKRRLQIPDNRQVILFLGRINRKKGTDILIRSFDAIPEERRKSLHLVIVGPDDGQLGEVNALIEQYQLREQVTLPGLLSGNEIQASYGIADLFILPCRTDTFPVTIIEACRAGVPMVVTETCEIADLIENRAATITPVDPKAIADAMVRTLDDSDLRAMYAAGAQELMDTVFSIEAVGDALEKIYTQVLEESRSRVH